jgi:hypothetical protein
MAPKSPPMIMKTILPLLFAMFICCNNAKAAERTMAEILDYGIYTGEQNEVILDPSAPTGSLLQGRGVSRLVKQTTKIPARLGTQFGFRFVVHGKKEEGEIKLHTVWLYPEITDSKTGKNSRRFDSGCYAKPEDKNAGIMWTFTEPSELVPGEWIFQVYRGGEKILEKKFEVEKKPDGK